MGRQRVARPMVASNYARFRDGFAALLDPALYPLEWLDEQIATGNFVLLHDGDSAILISVRTYPSGLKELHGEAALGNLAVLTDNLIPLALQFGKSIGCQLACIESRPGWSKALRNDGWTLHKIALQKPL